MALLAGSRRSAPPPNDRVVPVSVGLAEFWISDFSPILELLTGPGCFELMGAAACPRSERALELRWGDIRLLLRSPVKPSGRVAAASARHGGTVGNLELMCGDPEIVATRAAGCGLAVSEVAGGWSIDLFGDRSFHHTVRATSSVAPGLQPLDSRAATGVDHVALCLPHGMTGEVADVYEEVFGLERAQVDSAEVGDAATGMRSVVLGSNVGFTVVLTEPMRAGGAGQVQRFLDAHSGPGVQHLAIGCADILTSVDALRRNGVRILTIPAEHQERSKARFGHLDLAWDALRQAEVVVDVDDDNGLLYQAFTRPLTDRGTFFLELIQREGATGFGTANVEALFAAVDASAESALAPTKES